MSVSAPSIVPLERNRTVPPRSRSRFQLGARPLPRSPSSPLSKHMRTLLGACNDLQGPLQSPCTWIKKKKKIKCNDSTQASSLIRAGRPSDGGTHFSCRACGALCLPSCCSPVSSGLAPNPCTSSGSVRGTPPAAKATRSGLDGSTGKHTDIVRLGFVRLCSPKRRQLLE